MDGISVAGLVLGIGSGIVLFIKGIRKCKCTKKGISLERESNDEVGRQQEFIINLIELLHTYPKQSPEESLGGVSEISEDIVPEIKEKMAKMLEILNKPEDTQPETPPKSSKSLKAIIKTKKGTNSRKEELRKEIRKEIEMEIKQNIQMELMKKYSESGPDSVPVLNKQSLSGDGSNTNSLNNDTDKEIKQKDVINNITKFIIKKKN